MQLDFELFCRNYKINPYLSYFYWFSKFHFIFSVFKFLKGIFFFFESKVSFSLVDIIPFPFILSVILFFIIMY